MKAIVASVETRLARWVEETNAWQRGGHRTPAHFVAAETGTSIHQAGVPLQTGAQLEQLPATTDAFTSGPVTHAQIARAEPGTCTPTAPRLTVRIMARLGAETEAVFAEARRLRPVEDREPLDAYRFDALVRTAESTGGERSRAKAHVFVTVDAERLTGGDETAGRCEIKGVGSVPVETARALIGDALLTILVKKGVDVTTIAHDGAATMPIAVRRAVLARDPECVVGTCSAPTSEVHHVKRRADGGEHSVENCRGLCSWCHDLVHYHGYALEPNGDGTYHLRAPPD